MSENFRFIEPENFIDRNSSDQEGTKVSDKNIDSVLIESDTDPNPGREHEGSDNALPDQTASEETGDKVRGEPEKGEHAKDHEKDRGPGSDPEPEDKDAKLNQL